MVPVIAANGASFQGAFQYYCHDKQGRTTERVEWTQTVNMLTDCAAKAWKVMAYTAKHQDRLKEVSGQKATGAKTKKPVFAFSLSWAPEQRPDKKTMLEAARQALAALGLSDHQAIIAAHNDRPHRHVHIVANTIHPLTGLVAKLKYTKRQLSDFALTYEKEAGKIYCIRREENQKQREAGKMTRYCDPNIVEAWTTTNTAEGFVTALAAKGYRLAQGRKRLVIIDPYGKAHNPTRHLEGVRAKDISTRLNALDLSRLPDADAPVQEDKTQTQPEDNKTELLEKKAQEQREVLAQKHANEYARLAGQQACRLAFSTSQLKQFYGLESKKSELLKMKNLLRQAPWWKKLVGLTRTDRQAFRAQAQACRDAGRTYRHKLCTIADQYRDTLAVLVRQQSKETQELERRIEQEALREGSPTENMQTRKEQALSRSDERGLKNEDKSRKIPNSSENVRKNRQSPSYEL